MALTLPTQLSAFPLTVPPDYALCQPWFAANPRLDDCQTAFNNLPVNEDPIQYRPIKQNRYEPKGLLVVETHGQYTIALLLPAVFGTIPLTYTEWVAGDCQLKFHASGKWVEENDFAINISPNKIRNMFGRLIDKCVQGKHIGGFVTNGINNTMNWIKREDTEFPGEPAKTPGQRRNLYIPESATFLTAMIWKPPPITDQFEPGANHPLIGELLYDMLKAAVIDLKRKDPHSAFAKELQMRAEFLLQIVGYDQWDLVPPFWTWWGEKRWPIRGEDPALENGSLALFNATRPQVENITSLGLDRFGDEECTATANGPCSISRRPKRREKSHVDS